MPQRVPQTLPNPPCIECLLINSLSLFPKNANIKRVHLVPCKHFLPQAGFEPLPADDTSYEADALSTKPPLLDTNWILDFQNRKRVQSDLFLYDAFVSYSNDDEVWVQTHLVTNLEVEEGETDQKALHLCKYFPVLLCNKIG